MRPDRLHFVSKSSPAMAIGRLVLQHELTRCSCAAAAGACAVVNAEIDALLNTGKDVALFPEGTTTDGTHMLGFHAAPLQPAVKRAVDSTGCPVLPRQQRIAQCRPGLRGRTTLMGSLHAILNTQGIMAKLSPCRRCLPAPSAGVGANGESESQTSIGV